MSITKKQFLFIAIQIAIAVVWILIPENESKSSENCFHQFAGNWLAYHTFNRLQFYYFLAGNFVFFLCIKKLDYKSFILIESLLLVPVFINLYIYYCSN